MHYAISDLHLSPSHPKLLAAFQRLCLQLPSTTKSLWILGDLFDFWIGDDAPNPAADGAIKALQTLHSKGVETHFIPGNRDFLLGQHFAEVSSLTMHPDGKVLVVHGRPTWLIHGDHLCIDDQPYIEFRNRVRNRSWQQGFLAKPVSERIAMAEKARAVSASENAKKPEDIMDVNSEYTLEQTHRHGAIDLLHGHTHRPAQHSLGQDGIRYVLGDWREDHAVIARWNNDQPLQLLRYDYATTTDDIGTPL